MARAYDVVASALALQVDRKWLDNLLSHHPVVGVRRGKQGISRRIPPESLTIIGATLVLTGELRLPLWRALEIAQTLCESRSGSRGMCTFPSGVAIRLDVDEIERKLDLRLREIAEIAVPARRGRRPVRPPT